MVRDSNVLRLVYLARSNLIDASKGAIMACIRTSGPIGCSREIAALDPGTSARTRHQPPTTIGQTAPAPMAGTGVRIARVILSFDDGPAPVAALERILGILEKNAIKAEFYVLGIEVDSHPDAAKTIVSKGHTIQNHSWNHPDLAKAAKAVVQEELEKTQNAIKQATGITATKIRPPYGAGGAPGKHDPELADVAKSLSLAIEYWDIDTEDWKAPRGVGPEKRKKLKSEFERKKGRSLLNVLMHVDGATADTLQAFIDDIRKWGFSFASP
jgi:peptidoglycan/xylan/chitin deacetylase (PgdA/CDA1 family)